MPGHENAVLRPNSFSAWCELVCRRSVVLRGLKFSLVVGTILIAINHGDSVLAAELTGASYLKMGLTVIVPYVVSVFSSVGALVESGSYRPAKPARDESAIGA